MSSCNASNASSSVNSLDFHPSSPGGPLLIPSAFLRARGSAGSKGRPAAGGSGEVLFFGRGIRRAKARPLLLESCRGAFRAWWSGPPRLVAAAAAAVSELILRRLAENSFIRSAFARCIVHACVCRMVAGSGQTRLGGGSWERRRRQPVVKHQWMGSPLHGTYTRFYCYMIIYLCTNFCPVRPAPPHRKKTESGNI